MSGLKERRLKRYQRGEEDRNSAVRKILRSGGVGHSNKHRRRMSNDPSVTEKMLEDGHEKKLDPVL